MATRKFLFMDQTEGFSVEQGSTDDISLGKVTLVGVGGVAIDAGNTRIINVPTTPTATTDAVNQAYVDSVAQGLIVKEPVRAIRVGANMSPTGTGQIIDSNYTIVAGNRILLAAQTDQKQNGFWVAVAGTAAATGTVTAVAVANLDNNEYFTVGDGVGTPVIFEYKVDGTFVATSGRTTIDVSALTTDVEVATATTTAINASALQITAANTTATVNLTCDYTGAGGNVTITEDVADAGFTVAGMSGGTGGTWTRPADFAVGTAAAANFTFVELGQTYADTGWVCTNDDGTDIVGTDNLIFVQFSAAGTVSAGEGLKKIGNTISVKKGDGIEVTSNSAATNIDLATDPGLTLSGTSPNKKLMALIDSTGGLYIDGASGLALYLETTPNATLGTTATGTKVLGVPEDFTVAGTATHFNDPGTGTGYGQVTAANLDLLTAGHTNNVDTLHRHDLSETQFAVEEAVAKGDPLFTSVTTAGRVGKGDAGSNAKSRIIGLAEAAQATVGNNVHVLNSGIIEGALTGMPSLALGDPIYLADGGGLTRVVPGTSKRVIEVGFATTLDHLFVRIVDYGKKA